jgi:hypothetical protein
MQYKIQYKYVYYKINAPLWFKFLPCTGAAAAGAAAAG